MSRLIDGEVVFQRASSGDQLSIWKARIGRGRAMLLAENGYYPRWSPDGRQIAFIRNGRVMVMESSGKKQRVLADAGASNKVHSVAWHPDGTEVLFVANDAVKAAPLDGGSVRTIIGGMPFRRIDIAVRGARLMTAMQGHIVRGFDLPEGTVHRFGKGCSASLSPDGSLYSHLEGEHKYVGIYKWDTGEEISRLKAPRGKTVDNEFWSNHPDWIAARTQIGGPDDILLYRVSDGASFCVTFCGDCNRPDLYVR